MYVHIGWSVPLLAGVRGLVEDETFPPGSNLPTLDLYSRPLMILAVPTLEENIVLIQSSLFTLMIIVVCKLDYLMYINIKYVNTGDSSLTAERSFFSKVWRGQKAER